MGGPSPRPSFLCVDVVVREYPQVEALSHVVDEVKSLLDVSKVLSVAVAAQNQPLNSQSLTLLEHAERREKKKLLHWSSELKRSYKQFQFETALNNAAARGFFAGVKWLRAKYYPKGKFHGVERAAIYSGNLQMLQFLHNNFSNKMVDDAVVESQDAIAHAAANGRLDLVQWYCEMKGPYAFGWSVMDAAVAENHMHVVQYLDSVVGNRCTRRGLERAATNGHLEVVRWLNESRYYEIRTFQSLENAIAGGHLSIVQYIYTNKLYAVAKDGHLDVLKWLHDHKYTVHCKRAHVVRGAAAGGHKQIVEWMERTFESLMKQRQRIRVDEAAAFGDLQFVQWLYHKGYRFTGNAMDDAAARGYLAVVRWLHHHVENIKCSTAAMDKAAANGFLVTVQFLHKNRKEGCTTRAMDDAACNGHFEVVKFLYNNRSEYCTALAGESHSVAVLQFLKKNKRLRSRLPKTVEAATRGDLGLLQWLYEHDRRRFGFEAVVNVAREHNHFNVLRWLETLPESGG
eukprot:jgi/Phyca11/122136/e_gw1.47.80.1